MANPSYLYDDILTDEESRSAARPDLRVAFILMNKFSLGPVSGFVESLRFAADKSFRSMQIHCRWDWITYKDQTVNASCGLPVKPTKQFELMDLRTNYDYIVIAGGLLTETRHPDEGLLEALRELHQARIPMIALCSGCFVLANAGILNGRQCSIHFTTKEEFSVRFPEVITVVDKSYIEDRGIFTCPEGTAIDLATDLIRRHCGNVRAQKVLDYLLVAEDRRSEEDKLVFSQTETYENSVVSRAIAYMGNNLSAHLTLKEVAKQVKTTPRQLHRVFIANTHYSPASYWRKLRLEHAKKLLANTRYYITNIAIECGFSDASHFSYWFKKEYGETPMSFRKRRYQVEKQV